ncbi:hypothetical protein ACFVTX_15950 [Agromyces sp. NPDC058136]|uniref:hypothetical protein n=1 Tax=Agromyces sp. NPDC058136 TaxID=3346354 RepID=UPI0036D9439B
MGEIEVAHLVGLLEARHDAASLRAVELARRLPSDRRIVVAIQPADSTRDTFEFKYRMAAERGAKVDGLTDVSAALEALGPVPVAGCVLQGKADFVLVFLSQSLNTIIGSIGVDPRPIKSHDR